MKIKYLNRNEIDEEKWDNTIRNAQYPTVYALSWYLDSSCKNWDALVFGDYDSIMPLPWLKKMFQKQIYTPSTCQQLGVFSKNPLSNEIVKNFVNEIPKDFKIINYNLNQSNAFFQKGEVFEKVNIELDLNKPYNVLIKAYNSNTKRNLKKAQRIDSTIVENVDPKEIVNLFKIEKKDLSNELGNSYFEAVMKISYKTLHGGKCKTIAVIDNKNQMLAAGIFLYEMGRIINLMPITSQEGKKFGSSFLLFDHIIKAESEKNYILDFEGSNISGVANFYRGFGQKKSPILTFFETTLHFLSKKCMNSGIESINNKVL